jgi:hypothetical protein
MKKLLTQRSYYSTDDYLKDEFSNIGYWYNADVI